MDNHGRGYPEGPYYPGSEGGEAGRDNNNQPPNIPETNANLHLYHHATQLGNGFYYPWSGNMYMGSFYGRSPSQEPLYSRHDQYTPPFSPEEGYTVPSSISLFGITQQPSHITSPGAMTSGNTLTPYSSPVSGLGTIPGYAVGSPPHVDTSNHSISSDVPNSEMQAMSLNSTRGPSEENGIQQDGKSTTNWTTEHIYPGDPQTNGVSHVPSSEEAVQIKQEVPDQKWRSEQFPCASTSSSNYESLGTNSRSSSSYEMPRASSSCTYELPLTNSRSRSTYKMPGPSSSSAYESECTNSTSSCTLEMTSGSSRDSSTDSNKSNLGEGSSWKAAGKTRTKDKYRVVYSDYQREVLEKEFHYNRYITIGRKMELSEMLQLTGRQIKIWFQNRRAKERKLNKKNSSGENNGTQLQSPSSWNNPNTQHFPPNQSFAYQQGENHHPLYAPNFPMLQHPQPQLQPQQQPQPQSPPQPQPPSTLIPQAATQLRMSPHLYTTTPTYNHSQNFPHSSRMPTSPNLPVDEPFIRIKLENLNTSEEAHQHQNHLDPNEHSHHNQHQQQPPRQEQEQPMSGEGEVRNPQNEQSPRKDMSVRPKDNSWHYYRSL